MAEARTSRMQAAPLLVLLFSLTSTSFIFGQSAGQQTAAPKPAVNAHRPDAFLQAGHAESVQAVAISPDQKLVASAGYGKWIILWDANTGEELARISGQKPPVVQVLFNPDGRQLASTGLDGTVRFYDVASRKQLHSNRIRPIRGGGGRIAFSPDAKLWVAPSRVISAAWHRSMCTRVRPERW